MDVVEVERMLRARGCPMTPQRRAILRFLDGNVDHPTAAEVFEAVVRDSAWIGGPVTSRATVYNTLALLEELGAVRVERTADAEARFDPNTAHHHHRRCPRCGRLEDVPAAHVHVLLDGAPVDGATARVRFDAVCGRCA